MIDMDTALKQSVAINDLFRRLLKQEEAPSFDGDRIGYQLRADFTFAVGSTAPGQMTFNVPEDADFFGYRLNLFLQTRRLDLTTPAQSDKVFLPAWWCFNALGDGSLVSLACTASIAFSIRDSMHGDAQTAPVSIVSAFSGFFGDGPTAFPGSLEFHTPYYLRRGSTMTILITPTFSTLGDTTLQREYRVVGVFDGAKAVR